MLSINLFGFVEVRQGDLPIQKHPSRTLLSLLAYLILYRDRIHPRESLAEVFWSEHERTQSRKCLNTALWRLRCLTTGPRDEALVLSTPDGGILLDCSCPHWFDVEVFEQYIQKALSTPLEQVPPDTIQRIEEIHKLYRGDLLEGFYDDWVLRERERLRQLYLSSLVFVMQYYRLHGEIEPGIRVAQQILATEPLREDVHRVLMQFYASSGQRSQVIQQYRLCQMFLQNELGVEPMPETSRMCHQLTEHPDQESHLENKSFDSPVSIKDKERAGLNKEILRLRKAVNHMTRTQEILARALERLEASLQESKQ